MGSRDYVDVAVEYAHQVVAGQIPACTWVIKACERQLKDLQRDDIPYKFMADVANDICRFIEGLPHIKGRAWQGAKIKLEPWQCFVYTTVFGWVDESGMRRFKTVYIEVPRKNSKSTMSSGVGLFMLSADAEPGAEVYSAATTREQARIVFDDARRMVEQTPDLRHELGVSAGKHAIYVEDMASIFRAVSREHGGNLDGLNVHCGIIDELHAHKDRQTFDVIETATGSRTQPLLWLITTAGFNRAGVCYEQRGYVTRILNTTVEDDTYFGIIYTIDDHDDWTDPAVWPKANPNWGVSVNVQDFERKARKAMQIVSAQNNFLTKHLNVWVNADVSWMNMISWEACGDSSLSIEDFYGEPCHIGLDLASKTDIAAASLVFERDNKYYEFHRYYLNEGAIEDGRNSQYDGWARSGRLIVTQGNVTDYAQIELDLIEDLDRFHVLSVAYDPWQAQYLANRLAESGVPVVEFKHSVGNMSEPMKTLEAMVIDDRFRHEDCDVFNWMISNVVAHTDAKDNIYPRKETHENKIDGPVATIMAIGRHLVHEDESKPPPNIDIF